MLLRAPGQLARPVRELGYEQQPGAVDRSRDDRLASRRVDEHEPDGGQGDRPGHEIDEAPESEQKEHQCESARCEDDAAEVPSPQQREGGERRLECQGQASRDQTRSVRA
jgi:hypothetical protein